MGKGTTTTTSGSQGGQAELTINELEGWLWDAACSIRGAVDAPKFKDYILPLIFVKRLSDVFDDEIEKLAKKFGDEKTALELVEDDHPLVRFYVPRKASWSQVRKLTGDVGQRLTESIRAITKANPSLQGVIDIVDFNATVSGQRIIEDARLSTLIEILSRHRLGLKDVEADILGRAYEYLLRKFAEGQGQSAGEFFTPQEVGWLIARLLRPAEGMTIYDPACGSGGLLVKAELVVKESKKQVKRPMRLYGQELNPVTFAIAKMNMIIHDMEGEIAIGDTLRSPKFTNGNRLQRFDLVTANPMWLQRGYSKDFYENDVYNRFVFGFPNESSADWGWVQHMLASITDNGRAVIVIDPGAVTRGSGGEEGSKEREIRKALVDGDLVEGVVLLPENLFYNAAGPGILLCLNRSKRPNCAGKIVLINAAEELEKGRPKNFIPDSSVAKIVAAFESAADVPAFAKVITREEAAANDYNLIPSRYIRKAAHGVPVVGEALSIASRSAADVDRTSDAAAEALRAFGVNLKDFRFANGSGPTQTRETPLGVLPSSWDVIRLGDLFDIQQGKALSPTARNGANRLPFLRTANVLWGRVDLREVDQMHFDPREVPRYSLRAGDLLICEGGEIGRTAIWRGEIDPCLHQNHVHRLRPTRDDVDPLFYMFWMQVALRLLGLYQGEGNRTTIANLSKGRLANLLVPRPPAEEQRGIARALETVSDAVISEERRAATSQGLFNALLHGLMTGQVAKAAEVDARG